MAPQLGVSSASILQRLQGLTRPGGPQPTTNTTSPGSAAIDQLLTSYATGAAIPEPVLDGNEPPPATDPLQEYLNAGQPPVAAPVANPMFSGQPGPRTNNFEPVGIANDDQWHNLGNNVMEHQLNSNHNPRDVALFWGRKLSGVGDGSIENAQPYDPQHGDYSGFDGPPGLLQSERYQNAQKAGPGQLEGDLGGNTSNISTGTYAPPSMPVTSTGSYGDSTGLLNQYARSAPQPASNPATGNAIQQRLAKMRGGR